MHKHDGIPLLTHECDVQGSQCGTLEVNVWVFQHPNVKPNGNFMVRNQIAYPPQCPDHFIKTRNCIPTARRSTYPQCTRARPTAVWHADKNANSDRV